MLLQQWMSDLSSSQLSDAGDDKSGSVGRPLLRLLLHEVEMPWMQVKLPHARISPAAMTTFQCCLLRMNGMR